MIAKKLKERREKIGLTQGDIADMVGISRQYYNHLENGYYNNPSALLLKKLADALKISIGYFFK